MTSTISPPLSGPTSNIVPKMPIRGLIRGRKRDNDDSDGGRRSSSPEKKRKQSISFKSHGNKKEANAAPFSLVHEEVGLAFDKHGWSDDSGYNKIKDIYNSKKNSENEVSLTVLKAYTTALLSNVVRLNRTSSDLVHTVINSQWLGREEEYVKLFTKLLGSLVAQHGMYLGEVLRMLVENLTSAPPSSGRLRDLPPVSRSTIFARVHETLQYLRRLVPSTTHALQPVLLGAFPHETDSNRTHKIYMDNLLTLISYAPELRSDVLVLATDRLVKIDVGVQVDIEDLADDAGEDLVQKISQVQQSLDEEMEDEFASDTDPEDVEEDEDEELQRTKDIMKNVEKMDSMLDILFNYYDQNFSSGSAEDHIGVLEMLLSQFASTILPALRSRHTQFLLFHFAQRSPVFIDTFVGTCIHIAFDKKKQPAIVRQASTAYLASFVARGIHVPASIVRDVFDYISSELEHLRHQYEPTCKGPNLKRYTDFYTLVQALLYIFCFRWKDLQLNQDEDNENEDLPMQDHQFKPGVKESLSQNIFSKLNPLKVCSPAIVAEFARVANHLHAIYVFHILETNKRIRLSQFATSTDSSHKHSNPDRETALSMNADESHQHLDEYFPFDPYHLPKSKRWIEGDYREWAGVPGLNDQDTDSEADDGSIVNNDNDDSSDSD